MSGDGEVVVADRSARTRGVLTLATTVSSGSAQGASGPRQSGACIVARSGLPDRSSSWNLIVGFQIGVDHHLIRANAGSWLIVGEFGNGREEPLGEARQTFRLRSRYRDRSAPPAENRPLA
jgi:hypothetical protein